MMAGLCTVCIYTRREEVDAQLLRGRSFRELERKYGLARSSLSRHKHDHLAAELARAEAQRFQDIYTRFRGLEAHARRLLRKAEQAKDYSAAISALREVARLIALAEPPPPPAPPGSRVTLEFTGLGPKTRVLPATTDPDVIETTLVDPEDVLEAMSTELIGDEPVAKSDPTPPRPSPRYVPRDPHDPFWSDPRARDAREDLDAAGGGDPLKGL